MKEFLKLARLVGTETSAILGYPAVCVRHCTVCEGQDHHWMPDCDEETGEPIMACKHCDAERPALDEDMAELDECATCHGEGTIDCEGGITLCPSCEGWRP